MQSLWKTSTRLFAIALFFSLISEFITHIQPVTALAGLDPSKIQFQQIASGLSQPLFLTNAADGSGRSFIVERAGRIRILKKGSVLPTAFLDIHSIVNATGGEQGLVALVFHPDYESNGKFYTVHTDQNGALVLSQFTRSNTDPDQADANSRKQLLVVNHPTFTNHNGGTLAFGHDGYLYWSTGDGGSAGDPNNNAQNLNSLLGKILRIDVDSAFPYAIPPSNPFYNNPSSSVRKEIWAYGLRNPWRLSFDRQTHDMFIGDVGQNAHEEVDFQSSSSTGGENYGWHVMEGSFCYNPPSGCDTSGKVLPVAEYDHSLGCSITGGYVYRGSNYPTMNGHYFYSDFCSGRLFDLYKNPQNEWTSSQLLDTPYGVSSFGEDETGELYLLDFNTGKLYQIQYQESVTAPAHDDFNSPTGINNIPYSDLDVNIAGATVAIDDPTVSGCNLDKGLSSVWYQYMPLTNQTVYLDTFGSTYDTFIAVWTGARGNLTAIGCNDDADSSLQSALGLDLSGNQTYYFEIAQFNGNLSGALASQSKPVALQLGGVLDFHVRFAQKADIAIANSLKGHYFLPTNDVLKTSYQAELNGPVKVTSTDGLPIFASQRAVYGNSFNELMGYPSDQFATEYWFPWYDGIYMKTWILVGNPSSSQTAYVDIYIGGVKKNATPYDIRPGNNITPKFNGLVGGPVRVVSVTGAGTPSPLNIFASERSTFHSSFNEVMGVPFDQFTTEYWFPWYDNTYMKTWVLVGNPSATDTAYVDIYIGGVKVNDTEGGVPYAIPANGNIQPRFPGQPSGPVRVVSVTGDGTPTPLNIFSSERSTYGASFSEVMGMPFDQFTTDYWYTWVDKFNTNNMKTWILVGNPSSSQTAYVDIYIHGVKQGATRTIAPNSNITPKFDISNGAVEVVSMSGSGTPTAIPIFTSERVIYGSSFNEMMGYPANQLTTEYWFTWYDNIYMKTDVLVGSP